MSCLENTLNSPLFIVSLSAELILLTIHTSVLACILRQRAKGNSVFRSGFFTIYVIQSLADVTHYSLELVLLRLGTMGCVTPNAFVYPLPNISFFLLTYAANIQFTAHAAIAINRYFVLADTWTDRKQHIAVISIALFSLPAAALRFIGRTTLVETSTPGVYITVRDTPWIAPAATTAVLVYEIGTSVVSVVFELLSLARYRRLTAAARHKYRNDFLLLIYALLQFVIQLTACVCYALFAIGGLISSPQLVSAMKYAMNPVSVAFCLSPSLCLLSTSKLLRKACSETYHSLMSQAEASSRVVSMNPVGSGNNARIAPAAS